MFQHVPKQKLQIWHSLTEFILFTVKSQHKEDGIFGHQYLKMSDYGRVFWVASSFSGEILTSVTTWMRMESVTALVWCCPPWTLLPVIFSTVEINLHNAIKKKDTTFLFQLSNFKSE